MLRSAPALVRAGRRSVGGIVASRKCVFGRAIQGNSGASLPISAACNPAVARGYASGPGVASNAVATTAAPLSSIGEDFQVVGDDGIAALIATGRPIILHCGIDWSPESKLLADRLREWASTPLDGATSAERTVICASADLRDAPRFSKERRIRSLPAVLFFRGGKVEQRMDGARVVNLERMLEVVRLYEGCEHVAPDVELSPAARLQVVDELTRRGAEPSRIAPLCRQILEAGPSLHSFRARWFLLQALLRTAEAAEGVPPPAEIVDEMTMVLTDFYEHHERELLGSTLDSLAVMKAVAHAGLLVDFWAGLADGEEEAEALRLYAAGSMKQALDVALLGYKRAAGGDIKSLVLSVMQSDRPQYEIPRAVPYTPKDSVWCLEPLASEIANLPGPVAQRALLRRLFTALGPRNDLVIRAMTDLEFLLDTKQWLRWKTRRIFLRKGGKPKLGHGTGKRSGYSKGYQLAWDLWRLRVNTKKMNGGFSDKND
mmetsp:Transcript_74606/g.207367  ORF Transcript_74606/g.207367 Transcript_74606/m.207367 type:complete len:488 (+) Transcript_74606:206-1669(+)